MISEVYAVFTSRVALLDCLRGRVTRVVFYRRVWIFYLEVLGFFCHDLARWSTFRGPSWRSVEGRFYLFRDFWCLVFFVVRRGCEVREAVVGVFLR